jgi:hypothetical protein
LGSTSELGKNGEPKIPMVGECRLKGADYLVTQIGFESQEEVAKACFPEITQLGKREWATKDWRLVGLHGIVFFRRSLRTNFDWCLSAIRFRCVHNAPNPRRPGCLNRARF